MMTLAPRWPRATAIARPMPRDAPVTSATLPCSALSVMAMARGLLVVPTLGGSRGERLDFVRLADARGVDRLGDALDEVLQHRARAQLVGPGHPEPGDRLDRCLPAHRRGDLLDQQLLD